MTPPLEVKWGLTNKKALFCLTEFYGGSEKRNRLYPRKLSFLTDWGSYKKWLLSKLLPFSVRKPTFPWIIHPIFRFKKSPKRLTQKMILNVPLSLSVCSRRKKRNRDVDIWLNTTEALIWNDLFFFWDFWLFFFAKKFK